MSMTPFAYATEASGLEDLRLALRKAGPTSGISGREAVDADALLARVRDQLRRIAEWQRQKAERLGDQP